MVQSSLFPTLKIISCPSILIKTHMTMHNPISRMISVKSSQYISSWYRGNCIFRQREFQIPWYLTIFICVLYKCQGRVKFINQNIPTTNDIMPVSMKVNRMRNILICVRVYQKYFYYISNVYRE